MTLDEQVINEIAEILAENYPERAAVTRMFKPAFEYRVTKKVAEIKAAEYTQAYSQQYNVTDCELQQALFNSHFAHLMNCEM